MKLRKTRLQIRHQIHRPDFLQGDHVGHQLPRIGDKAVDPFFFVDRQPARQHPQVAVQDRQDAVRGRRHETRDLLVGAHVEDAAGERDRIEVFRRCLKGEE